MNKSPPRCACQAMLMFYETGACDGIFAALCLAPANVHEHFYKVATSLTYSKHPDPT